MPQGTVRESPGRTGNLSPQVFHGLVLGMILCLLRQTFAFTLYDMFILVVCQIRAIEPIWSVDPETGYGLLPCFPAFTDEIQSMCQSVVLELVCPEKALEKGCSVNIQYVLTDIYLLVFMNLNSLPWIMVFFASLVYERTQKLSKQDGRQHQIALCPSFKVVQSQDSKTDLQRSDKRLTACVLIKTWMHVCLYAYTYMYSEQMESRM